MDTVTGEAPRPEVLSGALISTVNRVASLPWGRSLWVAVMLSLGLALLGMCLVTLVITLKVFQMGAGYVLTVPAAQDAGPPRSEPFVMQAGG